MLNIIIIAPIILNPIPEIACLKTLSVEASEGTENRRK